jgi:hypothetical protein
MTSKIEKNDEKGRSLVGGENTSPQAIQIPNDSNKSVLSLPIMPEASWQS